jgi:hypothetical protein
MATSNWRVITVVTGALAAGATGFTVLGQTNDDDQLPDPIALQDRVPVVRTVQPMPHIDVIPPPIVAPPTADSSDSADDTLGAAPAGWPDEASVTAHASGPQQAATDSPERSAPALAPRAAVAADDSPDPADDAPPAGRSGSMATVDTPDATPDAASASSADSPDASA